MIKYLQTAIFLSVGVSAYAWTVGTEPTNKSVVIEEYTGIHCPNCPDGHKKATMLHHAHPDNLFLVSIHAGAFAEPSRNEPDYITQCGKDIHDYFDVTSYPSGTVNRRDVGNGVVQGRSDWGSSARVIATEISPVNLLASCSYDKDNRKLDVSVEGYFTGIMDNPLLTVEILQDNILGPQSGGLLGVEYPHRHMLRSMLNEDSFGDKIPFTGENTYFSKEYSVTLPDNIDGVPLIDSDIQILAFVSEGKDEIVKASKCFLPLAAEDAASNIFVQSEPLLSIGKNYALGYVELFIDNYSYQPLTEATFEIKLNNETSIIDWTGNVAPHHEQLIKVNLPAAWEGIIDSDSNSISIKMLTANNEPTVLEVLPIKYTFSKISEMPDELTVKITTDIEAADNTFRIIDSDGNTVAEFGPYPDGSNKTYEENIKLDKGKVYGFEVADMWGNGLYHPRGSVKFYDNDGKIRGQLMEISDFGVRHFFRTSDDSGIGSIEDDDVSTKEYFDLTGRKLDKPAEGVTIVVTTKQDGSKKITKKINNIR
ncbi:MAG: Omp28-related outer membrane protein [Muribaculaceae bacterium]|nr:Omp28-related outer membrane protein [Muribaculaceae bacterium]